MLLTEFTSPYSLNTQRGWHTSELRVKVFGALYGVYLYPPSFSSPHRMFTEVNIFNIIHFSCNFIISTEVQYQFVTQHCATSWH